MNQDLKREIILEHYAHPKNKGLVEDNAYQLLNANNVSCIDKFDLQVKFNNGVIEDIRFDGEGCAISTSTTSIMIDMLVGKTKLEALNIIDNYLNMINELPYDESILEEAIVYNEIYKQANRKKCASLTWEVMKEYLMRTI